MRTSTIVFGLAGSAIASYVSFTLRAQAIPYPYRTWANRTFRLLQLTRPQPPALSHLTQLRQLPATLLLQSTRPLRLRTLHQSSKSCTKESIKWNKPWTNTQFSETSSTYEAPKYPTTTSTYEAPSKSSVSASRVSIDLVSRDREMAFLSSITSSYRTID